MLELLHLLFLASVGLSAAASRGTIQEEQCRTEYTTVWDTIRVSKRVAMKVCDGDEDKNVSMHKTAEPIANTGPPPPTCAMNMSICNSNEQDISSVQQNATH